MQTHRGGGEEGARAAARPSRGRIGPSRALRRLAPSRAASLVGWEWAGGGRATDAPGAMGARARRGPLSRWWWPSGPLDRWRRAVRRHRVRRRPATEARTGWWPRCAQTREKVGLLWIREGTRKAGIRRGGTRGEGERGDASTQSAGPPQRARRSHHNSLLEQAWAGRLPASQANEGRRKGADGQVAGLSGAASLRDDGPNGGESGAEAAGGGGALQKGREGGSGRSSVVVGWGAANHLERHRKVQASNRTHVAGGSAAAHKASQEGNTVSCILLASTNLCPEDSVGRAG